MGRRRWVKPKTVFSDAQTEMLLPGGSTTQLEIDIGDPESAEIIDSPKAPVPAQEIELGDLFGYLGES
ncbi:MAG: hypothetical protein VW274_04650, partial [Thalassolituus sp.]